MLVIVCSLSRHLPFVLLLVDGPVCERGAMVFLAESLSQAEHEVHQATREQHEAADQLLAVLVVGLVGRRPVRVGR